MSKVLFEDTEAIAYICFIRTEVARYNEIIFTGLMNREYLKVLEASKSLANIVTEITESVTDDL